MHAYLPEKINFHLKKKTSFDEHFDKEITSHVSKRLDTDKPIKLQFFGGMSLASKFRTVRTEHIQYQSSVHTHHYHYIISWLPDCLSVPTDTRVSKWQVSSCSGDAFLSQITNQPVHTGPRGLDISRWFVTSYYILSSIIYYQLLSRYGSILLEPWVQVVRCMSWLTKNIADWMKC